MQMLEEQLEIVHGVLSEEVFSFRGTHYALQDCRFVPKGVQRPHPPIIVGGKGGPRMSRLVARWADEFNTHGGAPRRSATDSHGCARQWTRQAGSRAP